MEYNFRGIEKKWQKYWKESGVYEVSNTSPKPKFYVLDMFPYPSGAGLHVGHPLGYIASDIYARYKRLKGFNVLHPMGYDSFGLPAEQYALETGRHPAVTTKKNIETFRQQLDNIGFCFDWSREIQTSEPKYYKWTQWIFLQIFNSWYDKKQNKARRIEELIKIFEQYGNTEYNGQRQTHKNFSADEWKNFSEEEKQETLMDYRLAFSAYGEVNWCEALGTVLANDEVVNGVSERGGHPVVKKKMRQWYLRITDYAERLLEGLETVEFTDAMKEMQRNWIGKSEGAEMQFTIHHSPFTIKVYTTRPDTIFGVDFLVLAPEHELVHSITTEDQRQAIDEYLIYVKSRSDRERMAEVKQITGCFTGAYAINPFDKKQIPIWIAEYVLAGYGTGAIMAVPCGDQRDYDFAKHFNIPITNIIGEYYNDKEANPTKEAILTNSGFLDGIKMKDAIDIVLKKIEEDGIGQRKVNYKMRDAGFSRQRYWGEPFPIIYKNGIAYQIDEKELPVELPHVENYKPGPEGEGPLANIKEWVNLTPHPSPKERGEEDAGYITSDAATWKTLKPFARENRKNKTPAENLLWQNVRNRKVADAKFRRQHAIGSFIVDFVCIEKSLVIEVDGNYHSDPEQKKYDDLRTEYLKENGFNELRFTNEEVSNDISNVLAKIREALRQSSPLLSSPLLRRGVRGEVSYKRETNTMPGYAGSSWYFLRYMDPHNDNEFADRKATDYWNQVDVYIGGTEHAVGHLLYSRMWTKVLYDLGYISFDEPFKKLVNQGMIQGSSRFVYRVIWKTANREDELVIIVTKSIYDLIQNNDLDALVDLEDAINSILIEFDCDKNSYVYDNLIPMHVNVNLVDGIELNMDKFRESRHEFNTAAFICDDYNIDFKDIHQGKIRPICGVETEKMSKSKLNSVNPNDLIEKYGADTFRMYEMFLGPVEQSKPWDTKGIEGVHRFLKKLWRLFYDDIKGLVWTSKAPSPLERAGGEASDAELKILHKAIKKIEEDTERFSYNTAVSAFMVCVNELTDLKCHKKEILEPLLILLTPYAPHIAEELFHAINSLSFGEGKGEVTILDATYPKLETKYLIESEKEYPVSINGKMRTTITISLDATQAEVEKIALENEVIQKWMEGKSPKKIIFVKNKMVNVVV
jgi:leucyl-tRNA synthetase